MFLLAEQVWEGLSDSIQRGEGETIHCESGRTSVDENVTGGNRLFLKRRGIEFDERCVWDQVPPVGPSHHHARDASPERDGRC